MSGVHTKMVDDAHAYTRSDVPWVIAEGRSGYAKMINYISGGGMATFGRTIRQDEVRRRQRRFLAVFAALAALWLLLLLV